MILKSDGYAVQADKLLDIKRRQYLQSIPAAYTRAEALATFVPTVTQAGQHKRAHGQFVDIDNGDGLGPQVHWWKSGITDDDLVKLIELKTINGQSIYGTGNINLSGEGGGGSTYTFAALGIVSGGVDNTTTIQNAYNNGVRIIHADAGTPTDYKINGYLNVPGLVIKFTPGNRIITDNQTGVGTISVARFGRTVTGVGTSFTTSLKVGYQLTYTGVVSIPKTSGGAGYDINNPPTYELQGGGGSGAKVQAILSSDGTMSGFKVLDEGVNYTSAPTLVRTDSGPGTGAAGTVTLGQVIGGIVETINSDTSLTLRMNSAKALNGGYGFYGGVISGAIIDASPKHQIVSHFVTLDCHSKDNQSWVDWYGAKPDGFNSRPQMQKCIEDTVYYRKISTVRLNPGQYVIDKGLVFRFRNNLYEPSPYCSTNFIGSGGWIDRALGGTSSIQMTNGQSFGVNFQRCKGNIVANIELIGPNNIALNTEQNFADNPQNVKAGIRNNSYSPCAGWLIDGFATNATTESSMYPGFEHYYSEQSVGGSTGMHLEFLFTRYFVVNYCNSLLMQNGEDITYYKCYSSHSKIAFGSYNSQAILCNIRDCQIWQSTEIAFDAAYPESGSLNNIAMGYGQGGQPFEVDGANLQNVKWVFRLPVSYVTIRLSRIRGEVVYGWGGCFSPSSGTGETTLFAHMCWMNFAGRHPEDSRARPPLFMLHVQDANFSQCVHAYYERPANPINMLCETISYVQCRTATLGYQGAQVNHVMTRFASIPGSRYNTYGSPAPPSRTNTSVTSNATAINVSDINSEWSFVTGDLGTVQVGDIVNVYSENIRNEFNYGSNKTFDIGKVKAINVGTKTITVEYLPYGVNNGLVFNTIYTQRVITV